MHLVGLYTYCMKLAFSWFVTVKVYFALRAKFKARLCKLVSINTSRIGAKFIPNFDGRNFHYLELQMRKGNSCVSVYSFCTCFFFQMRRRAGLVFDTWITSYPLSTSTWFTFRAAQSLHITYALDYNSPHHCTRRHSSQTKLF